VAFVLCVTIAHLEDAKRYKGPVTFFTGQLLPLIGVTKWEALDNARKQAVDFGWLHYEPGNRGQRKPGKYWVTIPEGLRDVLDGPCDESHYPAKGESVGSQYPAKGDRDGDRDGDREGDREGEHSTLSLNPTPISSEASQTQPSEPPVLVFPTVGEVRTWGLMRGQVDRWQELYPDQQVLRECRKALAWCEANKTRRKTAKGMPAFLNRWLSKTQNQGSKSGAGNGDSEPMRLEVPKPRYVQKGQAT
jgi:hypothetical protein